MPKQKLDAAFVQLAHCPEGKKKIDYWDTTVTGLVLEVRASGGKTLYLRYIDANGRQKQHKIGRCEDVPFAKAKDVAKRLRSEVVLGGDPAAAKEERKAVPTCSWLADQHLAHAETYQKSYSSTETVMRVHIRPRWDKVRLDEIKMQDVAKWLCEKAEEGLKPATVEKIRAVFGRSFKLALQWNVPGVTSNPVTTVPRRRFDNARERYLTAAEAVRLRSAVAKSSNTQLQHIVGLLMLSGARVSELLHARWEHVDLERRTWLIPMSKNGKGRRVPLSKAAIDLIGKLPRFEKCPYLVPNPETLKPFVSIKHSWQTARREANLAGLRIHDLRHSAASAMINAGVDLYAVGRILGHADHKSTMRYAHLANDTLLAAVEAGASKLSFGWAEPTA
jgi:integrase